MNLQVIDVVLSKDYLFQGLPLPAIHFLRTEGLWMRVSQEILDVDERFEFATGQIYAHYKEDGDLLYLIMEKGEFLTASVYDMIDRDSEVESSNFLHQYATQDGNIVREHIQHIVSGVMFLELVDYEGTPLLSWEDKDIDYIIKKSS